MSMPYDDGSRPIERSGKWQDWANLILAAWLFLSPWILGFAPAGAGSEAAASNASWNAWVFGIVIGVVAAAAIARLQVWEEWVNALLGVWLFLSPWILGFAGLPNPGWNHWITGALVFAFAVSDLQELRGMPMHRTMRQH
jgi:hypothetical protein